MPIMTRMRDNMPTILFLLLIAFLVTIVFEWGMDYLGLRSGRSDFAGKINGKKVTIQEYNELVRTITEQTKAQGNKEPDEAELQRIREQAWQGLVTQRVIDEETKRLGIAVTDKEISDWVYGDSPPEDLRRYFVDSTGQFMRETFEQFLKEPSKFIRDPKGNDPNYGTRWLMDYEKNLRQRRLQEKLQTVIGATIRVSEGELMQRYRDQTLQYTAVYAPFDANSLVKDDEVPVTDADLQAYYEENIEQYKADATRKLKYVLFAELPSASDSASQLRDIQDAAAKARSGSDFQELVSTYSDKPDSGVVFKRGELTAATDNAVFTAKIGDIVGPLTDGDSYRLIKVVSETKSDKEFIHARHILFGLEGDTNAVKAQVQTVLQALRAGKDFGEMARQYSKDPGSAAQGGDLGWFSKGRMVAAFEAVAFKARVGEIAGPVRTQFGFHIIKVEGRDDRERKVLMISSKVQASSQTKSDVQERAKDFGATARESDFAKAAQQLGFEIRETQIQEKGGIVPGIGVNEHITKWAFDKKVGSVSEPFTVQSGLAVFTITEAKGAGVRPFDEVKESLRPLAQRKKKIERTKQIAADLRGKLAAGDSLAKITQLNPAIPVLHAGPFSVGGAVPGVGRDPGFMGTVMGLTPGQISPAVQGTRGAYLIQLLSRTDVDSAAFAAQRESLRARLLQEKRGRFFGEWLEELKAKADIDDRRNLYQ
jgi:peptidyl-prolyl cis-trans isomerase D